MTKLTIYGAALVALLLFVAPASVAMDWTAITTNSEPKHTMPVQPEDEAVFAVTGELPEDWLPEVRTRGPRRPRPIPGWGKHIVLGGGSLEWMVLPVQPEDEAVFAVTGELPEDWLPEVRTRGPRRPRPIPGWGKHIVLGGGSLEWMVLPVQPEDEAVFAVTGELPEDWLPEVRTRGPRRPRPIPGWGKHIVLGGGSLEWMVLPVQPEDEAVFTVTGELPEDWLPEVRTRGPRRPRPIPDWGTH